jgi:hypothetical protein
MSKEKVKFGSGLLGNTLTVYENRVEIVSGCFPFKRKRVIPISAITNVETPQFLNKVIIHTKDGKKASYSVGNAKKIQQTILERM